jgi:hypothetical protein
MAKVASQRGTEVDLCKDVPLKDTSRRQIFANAAVKNGDRELDTQMSQEIALQVPAMPSFIAGLRTSVLGTVAFRQSHCAAFLRLGAKCDIAGN